MISEKQFRLFFIFSKQNEPKVIHCTFSLTIINLVILKYNFDSTNYWAKGQASPSIVMLSSMENSILKGVIVSICRQEGKTNSKHFDKH